MPLQLPRGRMSDLMLVPIHGLSDVHFCRESYIMLVIWIVIGLVFYTKQRKFFLEKE